MLSGVHPDRRDRLADWLRQHGQQVHLLLSASELPLVTALEHPDRVGIDRLLNAVAVNRRRDAGHPAVVVSAGSAVVVDWVDAFGVFHGGAIFPGLYLMARALHEHTALLPLIDPPTAPPPLPGRSTPAAMAAGLFWAAAGGIRALAEQLAAGQKAHLFLTGGDAPALRSALDPEAVLWPAMTLEGVRLAAEALP